MYGCHGEPLLTQAELDQINEALTTLSEIINTDTWVQALRSGRYPQGYGTLRDKDDRYCCLGVACETSSRFSRSTNVSHAAYCTDANCAHARSRHYRLDDIPATANSGVIPHEHPSYLEDVITHWSNPVLPIAVRVCEDGSDDEPILDDETPTQLYSLAMLNDTQMFSQNQLADLINHFVRPDGYWKAQAK